VRDLSAYGEICLGLQYEKLALYRSIRDRVRIEKTPFEHILIASGNPATRTLDLVFLMFSFDPHGFRISNDWRGDPFTYVAVNGVLKSTSLSPAVYIPSSTGLCAGTERRGSFAGTSEAVVRSQMNIAANEILHARMDAQSRARRLVEEQCDDHIRKYMSRATQFSSNAGTVGMCDAVRDRVRRLYGSGAHAAGFDTEMNKLLEKCIESLPAPIQAQRISDDHGSGVDWSVWLPVYRAVLFGLESEFGPLGLDEPDGKDDFRIVPA
jgi:hypothetical protein